MVDAFRDELGRTAESDAGQGRLADLRPNGRIRPQAPVDSRVRARAGCDSVGEPGEQVRSGLRDEQDGENEKRSE